MAPASYKSILAAFALLGSLAAAGDKKCRALVLSGGGTNGAWEAGVIWGLTHYGEASDYYWDVHSGISAGSINTIGLVGWEPSQTVEAAEYLSDMWASVKNSDVYRDWVGHGITGTVESCLTNVSCFDTSPALEWLKGQLSRFESVKRRFSVSAVEVTNGDFITFNQTNTEFADVPQAALSSSSIPGAFPPQHFHGHLLMDGGTVWDVDPTNAIMQCLEVVDSDEDIIIDVAICGDDTVSTKSEEPRNSLFELFRAHKIHSQAHSTDSIADAKRAHPDINWRYLFLEENSITISIDFRNQTTWPYQMQGRQDAKDQLEATQQGFNGFQLVEDWHSDEEGVKSEYTTFGKYFRSKLDAFLGN